MEYTLNSQERRILALKAGGYTCEQIGEHPQVHLSRSGVESALLRIYRRFGARNDVQAVTIALRLNEITFDNIEFPPMVTLLANTDTP
jgi:DNA-binding CsgD family transcriptional regulator